MSRPHIHLTLLRIHEDFRCTVQRGFSYSLVRQSKPGIRLRFEVSQSAGTRMTWVLGSAPPLGYAALIADTRVTFGAQAHHDVLLKVHDVGSRMVAGFAGSVDLGFTMIESMQASFTTSRRSRDPREAALKWHRLGRYRFAGASEVYRRLGCSILLAGVSAESNGVPGEMRSFCIRMTSPSFTPYPISETVWALSANMSETSILP